MSKQLFLAISSFALAAVASHAATIVSLDPSLARFDSATDNDDGPGGFGAGDPGAENVNGLTFNVTFTPAAGDLDSTSAAVSLVEIGGDANGSGLYLLGGELHFISKMNGVAGDLPAFDDLNWASGNNMVGLRSSFGALSAGVEYSVAVVFDPLTSASLDIGVLPTGGSLTTESFSLLNVGTKTNWSGDDSASAFRGTDIGNFGGANTTVGNPFAEAAMNGNPFEGSAGQALYWSQNSMIIPEPSGLAFAALGLLLIFGRRRR